MGLGFFLSFLRFFWPESQETPASKARGEMALLYGDLPPPALSHPQCKNTARAALGHDMQNFYLLLVLRSLSVTPKNQPWPLPHVPGRGVGAKSRASDCTTFLFWRKTRRRK